MIPFEVPRNSRVCVATNRPLKPGEWFHSVLIEEENEIKRLDYSQDGWGGLPAEMIGYWKSKLPTQNDKKVKLAPNDILLNLFDQLSEQFDKQEMRYVLTLLLIRRRIFRLEKEETDDSGATMLNVYCPKREAVYLVPVSQPGDEKIEELQNTLATLLYAGS
jgi:hypothetical protein